MINGLEGIPGSGKSYEGVVYHVLPALKAGRKVITNLPLNVDAFAAIDPAYRDLIEVRTRPAPCIGEWNAANIAGTRISPPPPTMASTKPARAEARETKIHSMMGADCALLTER